MKRVELWNGGVMSAFFYSIVPRRWTGGYTQESYWLIGPNV